MSKQEAKVVHLGIEKWLTQLHLAQYLDKFTIYRGVEDVIHMGEADLKALGISSGAHRAKLASSLVLLRQKLLKSYPSAAQQLWPKRKRHSMCIEPHNGYLSASNKASSTSKSTQNLPTMFETAEPSEEELRRLKKELEWELSQDSRELPSHAWYHGPIPRSRAESYLKREGQFLVRDCSSGQPGDLVLSCYWRSIPLHFIITKLIAQQDTVYERIQFRIEAEPFDSMPDLITCYVGSGRPVTLASGAKISTPVNRRYPLTYYSCCYNAIAHYGQYQTALAQDQSRTHSQQHGSPQKYGMIQSAPTQDRATLPPKLKNQSSIEILTKYSTHSLPRPNIANQDANQSKLSRVPSDPTLSPGLLRKKMDIAVSSGRDNSPPPKPSRIPSMMPHSTPETLYQNFEAAENLVNERTVDNEEDILTPIADESNDKEAQDRLYQAANLVLTEATTLSQLPVDGSEISPSPEPSELDKTPLQDEPEAMNPADVLIGQHQLLELRDRKFSDTRHSFLDTRRNHAEEVQPDIDNDRRLENNTVACDDRYKLPNLNPLSALDLENFHTLLLPATENKPLDAMALKAINLLLEEFGSRLIAMHLLKADMALLGLDTNSGDDNRPDYFGVGITSGIALCNLPQGRQLRLDLLERLHCLKLFVATVILTQPDEASRVEMLHKWIEVAIESKTALGNSLGFTGIMLALCAPQIQRLRSTWHRTRQQYTENAYTFDAKLKPALKLMAEGKNTPAPNTTIPDLLPAIIFWEAELQNFIDCSLSVPRLNFNLVDSGSDFGLDAFYDHLMSIRNWSSNLPLYERNLGNLMENAEMDQVLLDIFHTEFQLKFLWGSKGAVAPGEDRYVKFDQVLNALSQRCEL